MADDTAMAFFGLPTLVTGPHRWAITGQIVWADMVRGVMVDVESITHPVAAKSVVLFKDLASSSSGPT